MSQFSKHCSRSGSSLRAQRSAVRDRIDAPGRDLLQALPRLGADPATIACGIRLGRQHRGLPQHVQHRVPVGLRPRVGSATRRLRHARERARGCAGSGSGWSAGRREGCVATSISSVRRRRFLQGLEERVGGEAVQGIGRGEHADLVAALVAGECQLLRELAHLLDADLARVFDAAAGSAGPGAERRARGGSRAHPAWRPRRLHAQHELRRPGGEPIPAGAGRLVDEERVRHPVRLEGGAQGRHALLEPGYRHAAIGSSSSGFCDSNHRAG